ncbi:MAG: hypothetical protein KDI31_12215 [Pseudomonadales bacterium]|nr:hypothetical protein [Pseudomonadales bacterium]
MPTRSIFRCAIAALLTSAPVAFGQFVHTDPARGGPGPETTCTETAVPGSGSPPGGIIVTLLDAFDRDCRTRYDAFNPEEPKDTECNPDCIGNVSCRSIYQDNRRREILHHGWNGDAWSASIDRRWAYVRKNRSTSERSGTFHFFDDALEVAAPDDAIWELTVTMAVSAHARIRQDGNDDVDRTIGQLTFAGSISASGGATALWSGDPDFPTLDTGPVPMTCGTDFDCNDLTIDPVMRTVTFRGRGATTLTLSGPTLYYYSGCPTEDCINFQGASYTGHGPLVGLLMGYCGQPGLGGDCGADVEGCGIPATGGVGRYPSDDGRGPNDHFATLDVEFRLLGSGCDEGLLTNAEQIAEAAAMGDDIDWNNNGVPDICDIADGLLTDCDNNNRPDDQDLFLGALDWNENGIPDTCDIDTGLLPDCDGDDEPDGYEFDSGQAEDWNDNDIPDDCDIEDDVLTDCDEDTIPDEREIAEDSSLDCNGNLELDECDLDDPELNCDWDAYVDSCEIDDGLEDDCDGNGRIDECEVMEIENDRDQDGQLDACEIAADWLLDSNMDGTLDACQNPPDEDGDGISDWQQIALDPSLDCNGNWRLDAVEIAMFDVWDSNSNGIPDDCERAMLPALDANGDGVLDREEFPPRKLAGLDADGDGEISREEMRSQVRGARQSGKQQKAG